MKVLIAIPCMDEIPTPFVQSLVCLKPRSDIEYHFSFMCSSLIYDARNMLAKQALDIKADYVLWLDSDIQFKPDLLDRLMDDIQDADVVTGLYFMRRAPFSPTIFKLQELKDGKVTLEKYLDYPEQSVFPIDAAGLGVCLMKTEVLKLVFEQYGNPFSPLPGWGEDISFFIRAGELEAKMVCDSRLTVGHVMKSMVTEDTYKVYRTQEEAKNGRH